LLVLLRVQIDTLTGLAEELLAKISSSESWVQKVFIEGADGQSICSWASTKVSSRVHLADG